LCADDLMQRELQNYSGIGIMDGVTQEHKKPAISPKRCKIGPRLLLRTNRKSHTHFWLVVLVLKSVSDLGWPWTAYPGTAQSWIAWSSLQ